MVLHTYIGAELQPSHGNLPEDNLEAHLEDTLHYAPVRTWGDDAVWMTLYESTLPPKARDYQYLLVNAIGTSRMVIALNDAVHLRTQLREGLELIHLHRGVTSKAEHPHSPKTPL